MPQLSPHELLVLIVTVFTLYSILVLISKPNLMALSSTITGPKNEVSSLLYLYL